MERPILSWIAIGLIIGLIAARILPGREPGGRILTVLISIAGALVAGVVHLEIGRYRAADGPGWIAPRWARWCCSPSIACSSVVGKIRDAADQGG